MKRCHCVINALHEIHVILFDGLPVPSTLFLFTARVFRANMCLVLHALSIKYVLAMKLNTLFQTFQYRFTMKPVLSDHSKEDNKTSFQER